MPKNTTDNGHTQPFAGFSSPNGTIVPDEVFDSLMPQLSDCELRVLLYIIRRTFGWKKDADTISLKQMVEGITRRDGTVQDRGAGLSKAGAAKGIKGLVEKKIVVAVRNRSVERGNEPTTYRLRFKDTKTDDDVHGEPERPLVHVVDKGGVHQVDKPLSTTWTHKQHTLQPRDTHSNIRKAHAKKSDRTGEIEKQPTATNPSVTDQSVSHSTSRGGKTDHHAQAAVVPADVPESSPQHSGADPARTRVLGDSVPSDTGVEVSSERPGEGFERLRETAAKIRAEVRQRQEAEQQEDDRLARSVSAATSSGMVPLADVLPTKRGRPPGSREDRDHITSYLADFRHELGDEAPLSSSVTRALNIFSRAHIPPERWADCLYQARSITKERSAQITKKRSEHSSGFSAKNRAPFYFAVLEDLCGLKPPQSPPLPHHQQP